MFAVVGCTDCEALWVVEGRPETTACPRCERRHRFEKLRAFAETETADAARNVRSVMQQRRADDDTDLADFATMGERAMEGGVDATELLADAGIDPEEAAAAGERATTGRESLSKREAVERAVAHLDTPTEAEIADFAAEHGVDRAYVERALRKLEQAGAVTATDEGYRSL
ncbi:DUF5817 domain-containing protein [Halosegnis sp.]|uniref:DUF5817 domain-containing protein n=1 Tax=Halosegnis sp. TaxID=2864959 RepID=UPI0035D49066